MKQDLIKDYLTHCYLYYTLSKTVISDYEFDKLCQELNNKWDILESPWKNYLNKKGHVPFKGTELGNRPPLEIIDHAKYLLAVKQDEIDAVLGYHQEFEDL